MKTTKLLYSLVGLVAGLGLSFAQPTLAQGAKGFSYKPPSRGAPSAASRVGGGTRGPSEAFGLSALAPAHVGMTVSEQPTLHWFTAERITTPTELVLVDETGRNPLLDLTLSPPIESGFHTIALAEQGVRLKPGVTYQWYVSVVVDPAQRSRDIISGGDIKWVETPSALAAALASGSPADRPAIYAEAGIWYDSIDTLARQIATDPDNEALLSQRSSLLAQLGLEAAARAK